MNYEPNVDAAVRLARDIWPRVVAIRPDAKLLIVGARPTPQVEALASDSITVTGTVPDVRPYLWQSAVAAAPLMAARGVQNKALEALAAGLPVVVSPAVAGGLPRDVLSGCGIAATDREFAHQLLHLLALAPEERFRIATAAGLEELTWERQLALLPGVLRFAREPVVTSGTYTPEKIGQSVAV
jgi:glycosyltransferase involved in cell wall biosynthesis